MEAGQLERLVCRPQPLLAAAAPIQSPSEPGHIFVFVCKDIVPDLSTVTSLAVSACLIATGVAALVSSER